MNPLQGADVQTLLSWSSGKDSAWALHVLRQRSDLTVVGLVTTINTAFDRVAMHGVRRSLVQAQADAAGLPLHVLPIPHPCPNEAYERIMGKFVAEQVERGITAIAFGDLYLEEVRRYREDKLTGTGLTPIFPLWQIPTRALVRDMLAGGLTAYVTCLDPRKVPERLAGRQLDKDFLAELPSDVDPCAENGEFHTFAAAGPMFARPLAVKTGDVVKRDGFVFCDLVASD
ncbi:MAG: adenine nucleotide alpha hydrolase [Hyphomonadaceae bacterium]|nr:adenine nucleotide alpha hydrolase [Hyphomonadaceae bacterium]